MILYRLAKWMEERLHLKRLIAETEGDSSVYIEQKIQVERRMLQEARQWFLQCGAELEAAEASLATVSNRTAPGAVPNRETARIARTAARAEGRGGKEGKRPEHAVPEELLSYESLREEWLQTQP